MIPEYVKHGGQWCKLSPEIDRRKSAGDNLVAVDNAAYDQRRDCREVSPISGSGDGCVRRKPVR